MERTSHWAALYFVLLMTFGNYVLFNLLVAILVEGFSKQDELFENMEVLYNMVTFHAYLRLINYFNRKKRPNMKRKQKEKSQIKVTVIVFKIIQVTTLELTKLIYITKVT